MERRQTPEQHPRPRGDFVGVTQLFDGRPVFSYATPRNEEERWGTVGLIGEKFYLVVWTKRNKRVRIISAYRADDWEIREYHKLFGGAA